MAYRISPGSAPRGVALLVHGAGNDALFAQVGLAKRLLERGLEVFSFHRAGHGRDGTTRLGAEAVRSAVPDAAEAAGAARRGLPLHAIGTSLGGSVLLSALPTLSPAPATAALLCAPLRVRLSRRAVAAELRPRLLSTLWRERRHYGLTGLVPSFGSFKRDVYPLRLEEAGGPGAFGYVAALNRLLESLRLEDAARRTAVPVLLAYGAADRLVPPEQGQHLARLLPRAELLVVPGGTHLTTPLASRVTEKVGSSVIGRPTDD
jgi:alpha-beta hydrolase superfamily lysophospholipase